MNKTKQLKLIPVIILFISAFILFIRAHYSFCWSDEPFYFATAKRFMSGDKIFYDEWFPTQLSSLLLVPFYSLFTMITGSSEGIILYFRILFVILEFITGFVTYRILSKYHGIFIGTVVSLFLMWYTHLNIATLSYYTVTLHLFFLSMLLLYDYYKGEEEIDSLLTSASDKKIKLIIAGVLFALSVLCLPTMTVAYFAVVAAGFIFTIVAKVFKDNRSITKLKNKINFIFVFIYTLIGIIIPAIVFLIYLFTTLSIKQFLDSLPYILSDDEHITSVIYPIKKMYLAIDESYGNIARLGYILIILSLIIFLVILVAKYTYKEKLQKKLNKWISLCKQLLFAIDCILFILYFIKSFGHTGYIFTAIMLFSIPVFFMTKDKNYPLFFLTVCSGLIYSLVFSYSSNGMLYVLSMGHFICAMGGIILVFDFIKELPEFSPVNRVFAANTVLIFISASLLMTCVLRITNVYRDDKLSNLKETISEGPAKGLHTSKEHNEMYTEVCSTINKYCMSSNGKENLLISKLLPFGYLISDMKVSAPTVWRNPADSDRLKEYYSTHQDRSPDVIYILDENYGSYETCGDVEKDPSPNENATEGYVYDLIRDNGYTAVAVPSGTVYMK